MRQAMLMAKSMKYLEGRIGKLGFNIAWCLPNFGFGFFYNRNCGEFWLHAGMVNFVFFRFVMEEKEDAEAW